MRDGLITKVQAYMADQDIEQLIVAASPNLEYLTGIRKCSGIMVVAADDWQLYLPKFFRYSAKGISRVSVFSRHSDLLETVEDRHDDIQYADRPEAVEFDCERTDVVADARLTKTDQERAWLREACRITAGAFEEARKLFAPGLTEWQIAKTIDAHFRSEGVDNSFETLAHASTLEPHRPNQKTEIDAGETVLTDLGCMYNGYCADMTRILPNGCDGEQQDLIETVGAIQESVLTLIEAGTPVSELATVAEQEVNKYGYDVDEHFLHALGHGVGIEVHEGPRIGKEAETVLEEGMVLAIEPGLYVPGVGGARTEEQVIVTDDGFERLTQAPRWRD